MADRSWKREIVPGKKKIYIYNHFPGSLIKIPEEYFDPFATCSIWIAMRGEGSRLGGGWVGAGRAVLVPPPLYLFQSLSVSHYSHSSLRDLTHWNPVKALCQQHRETERWGSREGGRKRGQETKQRWDTTLVLLSAPFFQSMSAGGCYPNHH